MRAARGAEYAAIAQLSPMTSSPTSSVGVALLGYGLGGAVFHGPLIASTAGLTLDTIVTRDPTRQAQARRDHPNARVVATTEEVWEGGRPPELVAISTPNRTHVPLALQAIAHGAHVVVDKPMALTATEGRSLALAATRAQRNQADEIVRRLCEIGTRQQQTQRTFLDWLHVEYAIEKSGNKLQAIAELDSDTLVSEVERIRGRRQSLTADGVQALRDEYTRTLKPARALAAEMLKLECALSDLVNQAYGLTPEEIDLMWKTAPPRMPIPPPSS